MSRYKEENISLAQQPALKVDNLQVEFVVGKGSVQAVRDVSFSVDRGQTLAIVGESGCGKSVTMMSVMGLIPKPPGRIVAGRALLNGRDILALDDKALNQVRGAEIAMIFQDPMSSLNPTMKIGQQIAETLIIHRGLSNHVALEEAMRLLDRTRIPEAKKRAMQYPFEFSGGMLQRVGIAMSLACKPAVLIADEPTTALDVTIQNQVLELMQEIQREENMAIVLITHDLGVVAKMADQVAVMYAGQIVEKGPVNNIFYHTAHPYTLGLKAAMPAVPNPEQNHQTPSKLMDIPGSPPDLFSPPKGCAFSARCGYAMKLCGHENPSLFALSELSHQARCWFHHSECPQTLDNRVVESPEESQK